MFTVDRHLPLIGLVVFLAVGFVWRPWLHYRRHGHLGIVLFRSTRPGQIVRDTLFVVVLVATLGQAVAAAVRHDRLVGLTIALPVGPAAQLGVGALLLFGGTALMAAAQLHLGKSWRIGIDEEARPGLVTGGLYRVSRNPIFLGMFVTLAGLVVLLPTAVSLVVLVVSIAGVRTQVLEEEAYLLRVYGDDYRTYVGRVGRFLPGIGTLH
jgi:protein-S-isoprenylcysteine O-methyltransferase Ste14